MASMDVDTTDDVAGVLAGIDFGDGMIPDIDDPCWAELFTNYTTEAMVPTSTEAMVPTSTEAMVPQPKTIRKKKSCTPVEAARFAEINRVNAQTFRDLKLKQDYARNKEVNDLRIETAELRAFKTDAFEYISLNRNEAVNFFVLNELIRKSML